ncbi:MAG: hypothetical protein KatS3mg024_2181 [Armatimonadota bacterium]|nr:MAG: hypothetical protein KatS3mg024_2181 [Armatimonadota bacterium]
MTLGRERTEKPVLFSVQGREERVLYSIDGPREGSGGSERSLTLLASGGQERVPQLMKSVREVMSLDIITIHPSSSVKSAIILMQGHGIGALPVVTDEALVGLVEERDLLGRDPSERISAVMRRDFQSISPDTGIRAAADLMARTGERRLIVEENGALVGIVTVGDLLPDLGKFTDPVTGLPWSDTLREWCTTALAGGSEVSIIFFDVDRFGSFNKKYGHVIGDLVLKGIASLLQGVVDPELDLLCRVGGDEFVISSLRRRDDALDLAKRAQERVARLRVEDVEDPISVSYGVSGGRRTREREATHYAATIDDLLNRASRECTAMKMMERSARAAGEAAAPSETPRAEPLPAPQATQGARIRIEQISYSASDLECSVEVRLSYAGRAFSKTLQRFAGLGSLVRLAADACAASAQECLPAGYRIAVEDVREFRAPNAETLMISTVAIATPREASVYYGVAAVRRGDAYRAAAASVLSALNRPLGLILSESAGSVAAS